MFYNKFLNYKIRIRNSARNLIWIRIRIFFGFVTALVNGTTVSIIYLARASWLRHRCIVVVAAAAAASVDGVLPNTNRYLLAMSVLRVVKDLC